MLCFVCSFYCVPLLNLTICCYRVNLAPLDLLVVLERMERGYHKILLFHYPLFSFGYISLRGLIELNECMFVPDVSHSLTFIVMLLQKLLLSRTFSSYQTHLFVSICLLLPLAHYPVSLFSVNFLLNNFFISAHLYLLLIFCSILITHSS